MDLRRPAHVTLVLLLGVGPAAPLAPAAPGGAGASATPGGAPRPLAALSLLAPGAGDGGRLAAAMRDAGEPYAGWARQGRHFLAFDPGGDGRAVEVFGDLATAERIAVLVPGVGSTLADFDRGLGGVARRAPARQARTLHDAVRSADPTARVAVLAWLGYDPPEGLGWAAARDRDARTGAAALAGLVRYLVRHRPTATVTLIGHSYGALVVGLAAAELPAQVTDLVALGGVGMGADTVAGLRCRARVWAAQAADDWIRWLPPLRVLGVGHGVRPADPGFRARRLPADRVRGHDGYLVPGSGTLDALARVVLGTDPDAAVPDGPKPDAVVPDAPEPDAVVPDEPWTPRTGGPR